MRYSFENPRVYADSNLMGFFNILEACRLFKVKNLILQVAVVFMEVAIYFHSKRMILKTIHCSFIQQQN